MVSVFLSSPLCFLVYVEKPLLWLPLMQDAAIPYNSRPSTGSCVVLTDPTAQLEHGTEETAASMLSVYLQQLKRRVLLRSRASF